MTRTPTQFLEDCAARYARRVGAMPNGQRNKTAFSLAGHLASFTLESTGETLSESQVLEIVRNWNERNAERLPDDELRTTVHSAYVGNGTPRTPHIVKPSRAKTKTHTPNAGGDDPKNDESKPAARLHWVDACDVQSKQVDWLMERRIPRGMLVCIAGVQGDGKSMVIADLAARISSGTPFAQTPNVPNPKGTVIIAAAEDSFEYTLAPRLKAHGADMAKIRLLDLVTDVDGTERPFSITRDLHLLEAMIVELGDVRLVVFDPGDSFLGDGINPNKAEQVRPVLQSLKKFCERLRITTIIVKHLNKSSMDNALHRVAGTSAYTEVPRCVWFLLRDREDGERRKFLCGKMNVARIPPGSEFTIENDCIIWSANELAESANEAMGPTVHDDDMAKSKVEEAEDWLRLALADGSVKANTLFDESTKHGIKRRTLNRAKGNLKIITEWTTVPERQAWWRLPGLIANSFIPPIGNGGNGGNGGNQATVAMIAKVATVANDENGGQS